LISLKELDSGRPGAGHRVAAEITLRGGAAPAGIHRADDDRIVVIELW
jgi:hypothetical protein